MLGRLDYVLVSDIFTIDPIRTGQVWKVIFLLKRIWNFKLFLDLPELLGKHYAFFASFEIFIVDQNNGLFALNKKKKKKK